MWKGERERDWQSVRTDLGRERVGGGGGLCLPIPVWRLVSDKSTNPENDAATDGRRRFIYCLCPARTDRAHPVSHNVGYGTWCCSFDDKSPPPRLWTWPIGRASPSRGRIPIIIRARAEITPVRGYRVNIIYYLRRPVNRRTYNSCFLMKLTNFFYFANNFSGWYYYPCPFIE